MSDRSIPPRRTGPLSGTGKLPSESQANPFVVRMDPSGDEGTAQFYFGDETVSKELTSRLKARGGLVAQSATGIPQHLHRAINDVLAFIYELDQAFPNRGKKMNKS
jgi:hypothetical protein